MIWLLLVCKKILNHTHNYLTIKRTFSFSQLSVVWIKFSNYTMGAFKPRISLEPLDMVILWIHFFWHGKFVRFRINTVLLDASLCRDQVTWKHYTDEIECLFKFDCCAYIVICFSLLSLIPLQVLSFNIHWYWDIRNTDIKTLGTCFMKKDFKHASQNLLNYDENCKY